MSEAVEAVVPAEGWGVLHLFFRLTGDRSAAVELADASALVDAFVAEEPYQAHWSATLGSRADIGLMLIGPDLVRLQRFHRDLLASELGARLAERARARLRLADRAGRVHAARRRAAARRDARGPPAPAPADAARDRVLPDVEAPGRAATTGTSCRSRSGSRLMEGHGRIGRTYAGKVLQLITGSTGLSDWEWGVTLLADDPKDLKEIVHEMRFDEVSSRYGEFGPFTVGLAAPFADALELAGVRAD